MIKNCKTCGVFDRSRVSIGEAGLFLSACKEQFDLILLDPPYGQSTIETLLPAVDKVTAPGGTVFCETEKTAQLPAVCGGLQLQKQYKYGAVLLWRYVKENEE